MLQADGHVVPLQDLARDAASGQPASREMLREPRCIKVFPVLGRILELSNSLPDSARPPPCAGVVGDGRRVWFRMIRADHGLALKSDGTVSACGYNGEGEVSDRTSTTRGNACAGNSFSWATTTHVYLNARRQRESGSIFEHHARCAPHTAAMAATAQ
jgi:alpha-tubulin suppressor-like RCC1 family protein